MQKRAAQRAYEVEYAPMQWYFRDNGTNLHIDFFSPPPGEITSLHCHDAVELGQCLEGTGIFYIGGAQYRFAPGAVTVIYPNHLHRACSTGTGESRWLFLTLRDPCHLDSESAGGQYCSGLTESPSICLLMKQILAECELRAANYESCVINLSRALLIRYERTALLQNTVPEDMEPGGTLKLDRVLRYMRVHYAEDLTARSLADLLFIHESTLRTWFRHTLGISPLQYLHQIRISAACTMLQYSFTPISEIAEKVGYSSLSSFHRNFVSICGISPREYRRYKTEQ